MYRQSLKKLHGIEAALNIYYQIEGDEQRWLDFVRYLDDEDKAVSRNAAWVMTQGEEQQIKWLEPLKQKLIEIVLRSGGKEVDNPPLCRLTMNLLERMDFTAEELRTDFLDFCLEQMQSLSNPPGIQSLCMKLAHKQCLLYPELHEELMRTLEAMDMDYYKPAVRSVWKKLIRPKRR